MKFCDLAKTLHKYRSNRSETVAVCVLVLTDAILDDVALDRVGEASKEVNPLYGLSQASLQSIYNGNRPISVDAAATILPRIDEEHFAEFVNSLSFDALSQLSQDMQQYGFDAIPSNVAEICANIMAQIIHERASGRAGDIKTLTIKKKEIGKRIKDIAPATIECKDGKLHICGEEIIIHRQLVPDEVADVELRYIKALCDAYADALHRESVSVEEIPSLPWPYPDDFKDQRIAYYSAESIGHSIRDTFDDGEDEFEALKRDAWNGISMTYRRHYSDGYERLLAVLEKITSTTLDLTVLSQIRNLIGNLEKKGICHVLVNDETIKSWVV